MTTMNVLDSEPVLKPKVVSRQAWDEAHKAHLAKEKAITRQRDALFAQRRELPWVKVEKNYIFETADGPRSLSDLFEGRSQLLVKHFMFAPGWKEGCVGCSFEADHIGGALPHLEHHDVSYVAISRAPLAEIEPFKKRMGWAFNWVSSNKNDFNYDFHVSATEAEIAAGQMYHNFKMRSPLSGEMSGHSAFYKDEQGDIFHTFSAFDRGAEELISTYVVLDLMPKGRNETGPNHNLTDWVRHHDRYDAGGHVDSTGRFRADSQSGCGCSKE